MSKVGKKPIKIPEGVKVVVEGRLVELMGAKGKVVIGLPRSLEVKLDKDKILLKRKGKLENTKALHGTYRALLNNAVKGVSTGWIKTLELVGTGYRAQTSGNKLILTVGYSHPVEIVAPDGISFKVEKNEIAVEGIDKQMVGEVAAKIRSVRPPEPYKGKGIKYKDEVVRRKPGKAAKAAGVSGGTA